MAVWQFPIMLIPSAWETKSTHPIRYYLTDLGWDLTQVWKGHRLSFEQKRTIDQFMPASVNISEGALYWGDQDSHNISIDYNDDQIEAIQIRIDMRQEIEPMIETAVKIAEKLSCKILVMETGEIIMPDPALLARHASKSRAAGWYWIR